MNNTDPFLTPCTSLRNRSLRTLWGLAYHLLFRPSPRPLHAWRACVLRAFGARIGPHCHIYPRARIWAPWNLICEDLVAIADGAEIYNAAPVTLGSHSIVSQDAYVCTATHDFRLPHFPMVSEPIRVGAYAWVAARATVCPGVSIGDGAVLGLGSIATRDLAPLSVNAGIPARRIGSRPATAIGRTAPLAADAPANLRAIG